MAVELRKQKLSLELWRKRPALTSIDGKQVTLYIGQSYDTTKFSVIPDGWDHDHCEFCWSTISDRQDEINKAYTNGKKWICPKCFQSVIVDGIPHAA